MLEALIVTCGHETTSSAIGGGLLALLEQRDQLEMLQANPELIDNAADELIRFRPAGNLEKGPYVMAVNPSYGLRRARLAYPPD